MEINMSEMATDAIRWNKPVRPGVSGPLGRILGCARWEKSAGLRSRKMRTPGYYALVYTIAGRGQYEDANGYRCMLRPESLLFVFPDLQVLYGPAPGCTWTEFWIAFEGPVFETWDRVGLLDRADPVVQLSPQDYWLARFESILESRPGSTRSAIATVCRLQDTLAEILNGAHGRGTSRTQAEWLRRAEALVQPDAPAGDLASIARKLGMSADAFRKRFTGLAGMPPMRYRAERVIQRACELLLGTDMLIKEIAYSLGFADEFHFSHRFKQFMGRSPRAFRKDLPG
jgi:AraC-like DNA-binding protein